MGLKCHLPLTHRQCDQRTGRTWNTGAGCQLPDLPGGKHEVPTDRAGLEALEESTALGDEGRKENRRVMLGGVDTKPNHSSLSSLAIRYVQVLFQARGYSRGGNRGRPRLWWRSYGMRSNEAVSPLGGKSISFLMCIKLRNKYNKQTYSISVVFQGRGQIRK